MAARRRSRAGGRSTGWLDAGRGGWIAGNDRHRDRRGQATTVVRGSARGRGLHPLPLEGGGQAVHRGGGGRGGVLPGPPQPGRRVPLVAPAPHPQPHLAGGRPGGRGGPLRLHLRPPAHRPPDQGVVSGGHRPAGRQLHQPDRPGRGGGRGRRPVPDAGGERHGSHRRGGGPHRLLAARHRRAAGPAGAGASHRPLRLAGRLRPLCGGHHRSGGVRAVRRLRSGGDRHRRPAAGPRPRHPVGPQPAVPQASADDRAGGPSPRAAQPDPHRARPAVVAGHPAVGRPSRPRLPLPLRVRAGGGHPPPPVAGPAGLRGGRGHRAGSHHPWRPGDRGGQSLRPPGPGRAERR